MLINDLTLEIIPVGKCHHFVTQSHFLRESKSLSMKWNPLMLQTFPTQIHLRSTRNNINAFIRTSSKLSTSSNSNYSRLQVVGLVVGRFLHGEALRRLHREDIRRHIPSPSPFDYILYMMLMAAHILLLVQLLLFPATQRTTVLKLQVGLLGMARYRIAEAADTSTPEGLNSVLTETTLAMLRHADCWISGYSFVDVKPIIEDGEKHFNQLSIEERGKFDEETLVNVNNIKRQSTSSRRANGLSKEYILTTFLVAAEGLLELPAISGTADLKDALQNLGSIPASKTLAVEALWTPQNENDTLTEGELLEDYPLLRPLLR
ncbi:Protein of unknown function DUF1517 [Macleaya cordata]|uniref:Uncharacterized protein n=1 Tax=Macleaya cordata TaxID=56857 RepID=A0A200Q4U9_MACCD|nr:Protein of unknown function DUF1517 [Macleaya cordata]